ncbi:MAG: hypothetical protein A3F17_05255 [Gammaproteobacteria bacterium RIFCSPHIGHO2_12_FULL_41_15]|nr:MAG: hypothetical protein A3F17_05255 [Gammaproteobacteria bacterium RIFCSPHIGHO2_12_FULL_41_15]
MDSQAKQQQHIIPLYQAAVKLTKPRPLSLTEKPFVRFCLNIAISDSHGTALQLLRQQQGFNTNMLLYICWQSLRQHGRFKLVEIRDTLQAICLWRESIVRPLEYIVEDLQGLTNVNAVEIRKHVEVELKQADIVEKCMLSDIVLSRSYLLRSTEQQLQDMCHGVSVYARILSAKLLADDIELFVKLFQSLLPDLCPKKVSAMTREKLQKVATDFDYGYSQLPLTLAV